MILERGGGESLGSVQTLYEQKRFMTFKLGYTAARVHARMLMGNFKQVCVKVFWVLFLKIGLQKMAVSS